MLQAEQTARDLGRVGIEARQPRPRAAFLSGAQMDDAIAAEACASFLAACNHVSPDIIAALRFIDAASMVAIMSAATGLSELKQSDAGV